MTNKSKIGFFDGMPGFAKIITENVDSGDILLRLDERLAVPADQIISYSTLNFEKFRGPQFHFTDTDFTKAKTIIVHGRMYFIVNDEHIDITDQVSETEPYIYQFTDEENVLHYWIIGKNGPELEHYGFAEYLHPSESEWTAGYVARTNGNTAPWLDKAKEELGFDF